MLHDTTGICFTRGWEAQRLYGYRERLGRTFHVSFHASSWVPLVVNSCACTSDSHDYSPCYFLVPLPSLCFDLHCSLHQQKSCNDCGHCFYQPQTLVQLCLLKVTTSLCHEWPPVAAWPATQKQRPSSLHAKQQQPSKMCARLIQLCEDTTRRKDNCG